MRVVLVNDKLQIMQFDLFYSGLFEATSKPTNDCGDMMQRSEGIIMIKNGFRK